MLNVDEALALVLARAAVKPPVELSTAEALGMALAETVVSDIDSPPHDKALVDGFAVRSADLAGGPVELTIVEEITAGQVPTRPLEAGQATRIMTGAPLPTGADAAVMVEHVEFRPAAGGLGTALVRDAVPAGRNLLKRAAAFRAGQPLLQPGHLLRAAEIGLLAEVGRTTVRVTPRPTVAVLSTGNELVPPEQVPKAGQIRNSNGPLLHAAVLEAGAEHTALGIARDDADELRWLARAGLSADILVLSGGVSAGVLDLVPGVLRELGVEEVFHKVRLKPGKPLWFGGGGGASPTLVFGLPGNPVSSLVCFLLFVRPAIDRLAGRTRRHDRLMAALSQPFSHRGDRPTYHPGKLHGSHAAWLVEPLAWQGSADLRTLAAADALMHFPPGDREYPLGAAVEVVTI